MSGVRPIMSYVQTNIVPHARAYRCASSCDNLRSFFVARSMQGIIIFCARLISTTQPDVHTGLSMLCLNDRKGSEREENCNSRTQ